MKPIPSPDAVKAQGQIELDFSRPLDPQDSRLPKPTGAAYHKLQTPDLTEVLKLEAVRKKGGLVADNGLRFVWSCPVCGLTTKSQKHAFRCCHVKPKLLQVCVACGYPDWLCHCLERKANAGKPLC